MKTRAAVVAIVALALTVTMTTGAQTTGRIVGTVLDVDGGALAGVTVTATSPISSGHQAAITRTDGSFCLLNLAPGSYAVRAERQGFITTQHERVLVGVDRTLAIEWRLSSEIPETIQVTDWPTLFLV